MNNNRLKRLLATYGSHIENWPECDQNLFSEIKEDTQLKAELTDAQFIDFQLDTLIVKSNPNLEQLILDNIRPQPIDLCYQWLFPNSWKLVWQPAMAAMLIILLGFGIGMEVKEPDTTVNNWEDQLYWVGFATEDDFYE